MSEHDVVVTGGDSRARVRAYVAQVRAELSDLPPEEVEDLTMGMEADLSELAAESAHDVRDHLGTPQAYAAELRSAAGLPVRAPRRGAVVGWALDAQKWAQGVGRSMGARHGWLRELRGTWWLVRGLLIGSVLGHLLLGGLVWAGFVGLVAAVASMWLGLRRFGWWPRAALNAATIIALPLAIVLIVSAPLLGRGSIEYLTPEGVFNEGVSVGNLYAYDAQGRRLDGVRIFDQTGRQVSIYAGSAGSMTGLSFDVDLGAWSLDDKPERLDSFPVNWLGDSAWSPLTNWVPPLTIVATASPGNSSSPASTSGQSTSTESTSTQSQGNATLRPSPTSSSAAPPGTASESGAATPSPASSRADRGPASPRATSTATP